MKNPSSKLNKQQIRWLRQTGALTFREMNILMERYLLNKTLPEIAQKYSVETERIRQLEENALKKISIHSTYDDSKNARRKTGNLPSSTGRRKNNR